MPRFVILEHDHPELHWDLMLETGAALRTWRLANPPVTPEGPVATGPPIAVVPLGDHRLDYLDYEGPVSGNRGVVKRWDRGDYEELPAVKGTRVRLAGTRFAGVVAIGDKSLVVEA